ncbi:MULTISPECIES: MerR family transcriptional regulator [Aliarcobacter]|jgi:DNA-binding transcriptional MerR regulator|uniref:MerR family transcriptional regulator n=2 Tax=Aliarcobacter skirrowii TaxID=28200 RepID=A0A2U2C3D3_9BACT|nr:MerR family transcriptional regulator [Aliarcobacter skirrowii]AXX83949.1 transcriptional regulator, MerR family [Aliarcobacter skirrowii CCUG 10374]AZL53122.1 MerR family transcriptional regulator [Aliarcobacter skirrowii]KAB0621857.1 MerR family transcriptional regulator [Aliarcobacter skirrowii CCUG 10374]MCT7446462.1 MerR family transcriptional regulator [Aliarcobacter skirrowii]MDD2507605.1 MerR family transcriptional regulator [Aliarcobacter skirrowii]
MALLNNQKNILPLSSISELLNTKTRTLKMYEEKKLLPLEKDKTIKKLYSIDDIKMIAFVHYLATIKKINSNGISYILEILEDNMDSKHKEEFLKIIDKKLETLSSSDSEKLDNF